MKKWGVLVFALVFFTGGALAVKYFNDERQAKKNALAVVEACFVSIRSVKNDPDINAIIANYRENLEKYRRHFSKQDTDYSRYVSLCDDFYQVIIAHAENTRDVYADYTSERMKDRTTVQSEPEYQWRMQTLERASAWQQSLLSLEEDVIDAWRQKLVASNLDEDMRVGVFGLIKSSARVVSTNIKYEMMLRSLSSILDAMKDYYTFMFENRERYEVVGDRYMFKTERTFERFQQQMMSIQAALRNMEQGLK